MSNTYTPPKEKDEQLSIDLKTLLLSLLRHWYIAALCMITGIGVGVAGAYLFGAQTWQTETVLLYKPAIENNDEDPSYTPPPITTQMNLVKIRSNLEETRHILDLDTRLDGLGRAIEVFVQAKTDLLVLSVTWDSATRAADIANTIRDVFVSNQERIRQSETGRSIDHLLRQSEIEKRTIDRQLANINQAIEEYTVRVKQEQEAANLKDVQREIDIRSSQLRKSIAEDQVYRSRVAELTKAEVDLGRAQKALDTGVVSQAEYDAVNAEYDRLAAHVVDTDQIKEWKGELERLDNRWTKISEVGLTPSAGTLSEMRMKMFDLQLQEVALDNKIQYLEEARASVISDFTVISEAQGPSRPYKSNRMLIFMGCVFLFTSLGFGIMIALELLDSTVKSAGELRIKFDEPIMGNIPHVKVWHQVMSGLIPLPYETKMGLNQFESPIMEPFRIISRQLRVSIPKQGARILVASAHHGEGKSLAAMYLAACLGRQDERVLIMDAYVRSDIDQERFTNYAQGSLAPGNTLGRIESIVREPLKTLFGGKSQHTHGLNSSSLTMKLYQSARRVTRRQPSTGTADTRLILRDLIPEDEHQLKGLGEYLSYEADESEEITWPTVLSGVECLPHIGKAVIPELLGSHRTSELMDELSSRYSVVLIDGPPVLPYVDADLITHLCDGIVFVVRSQWCQIGMVKKAFERLNKSGVPVVGIILNDVDPLHLESE
jgi:Mrp family chromosome partitioning ATPase/capsular polysaccharide biosynthesis protein